VLAQIGRKAELIDISDKVIRPTYTSGRYSLNFIKMKKFNEFECWMLVQSLELLAEAWKVEIDETEAKGKMSLFTKGYVDIVTKELTEKVKAGTLKPRKTYNNTK